MSLEFKRALTLFSRKLSGPRAWGPSASHHPLPSVEVGCMDVHMLSLSPDTPPASGIPSGQHPVGVEPEGPTGSLSCESPDKRRSWDPCGEESRGGHSVEGRESKRQRAPTQVTVPESPPLPNRHGIGFKI